MKILFYQPYNQATIYIESIAEQLALWGHDIFFISHEEKGATHSNMEKWGTKTYSSKIKKGFFVLYHARKVFEISRFCKKNNIDIVYSHYQEANIISVFAQYFCKSKFILTRHHTDCAFIDNNLKEKWADKIINRLAYKYIAPSQKVFKQLVDIEKANPEKIQIINYGYNFNSIHLPNLQVVQNIKTKFNAKLLLVSAARFIPEKRHDLLISEIKKLIKNGLDVKLLILGKGPLKSKINEQIKNLRLENNVFNLGFKLNIIDYYSSADLIVHFSLSEASNSAIKEASITNTPVMVCSGVGDFDEYIVNKKNGFLLNKKNPQSDFSIIIEKILNNEFDLLKIGKQLHKDVVNRFDISRVIKQYLPFNKN
ncbi:MAG: glycosyltransferase family 4 protein [Flavobacteriaceae bacterium]|nr:glycosyltransferase family 4 protein [Flavobacteriaceae bacterium]